MAATLEAKWVYTEEMIRFSDVPQKQLTDRT